MGMTPDLFWSLTFREFQLMLRAHEKQQEVQWTHTSSLMALHANMNAQKGKKFSPDDFNPYVKTATENEGIDTKSDVLDLMRRVNKL